jgi:uncharacterized protein YuzE
MRLTYDQEADALYIELKRVTPVDSRDLEDGVTVDLGEAGRIIGIELLDVQKRFGPDALAHISIDRLPAGPISETARP